jgi:hypothetical protein
MAHCCSDGMLIKQHQMPVAENSWVVGKGMGLHMDTKQSPPPFPLCWQQRIHLALKTAIQCTSQPCMLGTSSRCTFEAHLVAGGCCRACPGR